MEFFFNNCLEIRWHISRWIHFVLPTCVCVATILLHFPFIPSRPNIKILMMCTWFWVITIFAEEIYGEINLKCVSVWVCVCVRARVCGFLVQAATCHSYHFILFSIRITKMHISCEAQCASTQKVCACVYRCSVELLFIHFYSIFMFSKIFVFILDLFCSHPMKYIGGPLMKKKKENRFFHETHARPLQMCRWMCGRKYICVSVCRLALYACIIVMVKL